MTHPLPKGWQEVLLDEYAKRGSGHTPNKKHPEYWDGQIKWISLQDSSKLDKFYISETAYKITEDGIRNSSAVIHPAGTVVLSRDAGVGKSAIMKEDMAVSQHFMTWRCGLNLNNIFLYHWLQYRKPEFERIAVGSTIKTIGLPYFKKLKIILPPLPEQHRIVTVLETWDKAIEKLERKIALKKSVKKGLMQQLLTGKKRLPGFGGEWVNQTIGMCVKCKTPPKKFKKDEYLETGEYPIIDQSQKFIVGWTDNKSSIVENGEYVLFGDHTCITKYYCGPFAQGADGLKIITTKKESLLPAFLYQFLCCNPVQTEGYKRHYGKLKDMEINIPTTEEQKEITSIFRASDQETELLQSKLQKLKLQKTYLLNHLITGRIRTPETMSLSS